MTKSKATRSPRKKKTTQSKRMAEWVTVDKMERILLDLYSGKESGTPIARVHDLIHGDGRDLQPHHGAARFWNEALELLEEQGYIARGPVRGARLVWTGKGVVKFAIPADTPELEVLELRLLIEPIAARLAAVAYKKDADPSEPSGDLDDAHQQLRDAYAALAETAANKAAAAADQRFHLAIHRLAGNKLLQIILRGIAERIKDSVENVVMQFIEDSDYIAKAHDEHEEIYDAICHNSSDEAAKKMEYHLSQAGARKKAAEAKVARSRQKAR